MAGESSLAASGCMLGVIPDNFSASACNILLEERVPLFGASTSGQQASRTVDEHRHSPLSAGKGKNGESERGINGGSRTCCHGSPRGSFADYW